MGSEEKRLKVDISFSTSLKFWLAFLVMLIIAMMIAFTISLVLLTLIQQWIIGQLPAGLAPSFLPKTIDFLIAL